MNEITKEVTLNGNTHTSTFTANVWEKYGKRIVFINGSVWNASYDLNKSEWREVPTRQQKVLESAFAEILELEEETMAQSNEIEIDAEDHSVKIEAQGYEALFQIVINTIPAPSEKRTVEGLRYRMVIWDDFVNKNGTAYGACFAEYYEQPHVQ